MLQGQFQAHHKTRNDFFYWIEREDPFQLIRKAAWLPILGLWKLVECVLLYSIRWFFSRFARAWHSVTVSKRREGGIHSIHRRESGLIRRCLAATTSKGKICFACTFGCGGRISLFFGLKIGFGLASLQGKFHLFTLWTTVSLRSDSLTMLSLS